MAIKHIAKQYEYIGLSTDDKSGITTEGSVIYYTDTSVKEVYHNGNWIEVVEDNYIKTSTNILNNATEEITHGIRSINTDHGAIHLGWGYCVHLYHPSLGQGDKKIYRYKAPTTQYAHIKSIQVNSAGSTIRVRLVKNPTITVAGTEISCISNLNHNSENVAESKIYDGNVEFTGGETWCEIVIHGDTVGTGIEANKTRSSGSFIQSDYLEYITKSNDEDYIIEIENIGVKDVPAVDVSIDMFFYEEPQGVIYI